jgi:Putative peptidoglycan binding domain
VIPNGSNDAGEPSVRPDWRAARGGLLSALVVVALLLGCGRSSTRPTGAAKVDRAMPAANWEGVTIAEYHAQQTQGAEEEAKALGYKKSEGTVLKLRRASVEPVRASPSKAISFEIEYALLSPEKELDVSEQWEILKDGKKLTGPSPHTERRRPGRWRAGGSIDLPREVKPGAYIVRSSIRVAKLADTRDARFVVVTTAGTKPREEIKSTGALGPVNRDLMQVQGRLKELGHDPGPIDGRLGLETQAALKAFQTDYGLAATGEIDAETRAALGLGRKGPP